MPTIIRSTRSNTSRLQGKNIPIGQPKVVLTDLIHTVGKEKLAVYRISTASKTPIPVIEECFLYQLNLNANICIFMF